MNVPAVLQNIRSKHPVAYVVLYLFVVWVLLVIITHAIAFGAELLIASSDQPVVKWETTDECTDGTRTIYYNSPSLYQEFKVKIKDSKIVDAELGSLFTIGATVNAEQVEYTDSHATYRIDLSILADRHAPVCSNAIYAAPRCTCPKYRCARARGSLLEQYTRLRSYSTGLKMVDWPKTLRMRALASSSVCGMLGAAP